jgi:hypothetical protein
MGFNDVDISIRVGSDRTRIKFIRMGQRAFHFERDRIVHIDRILRDKPRTDRIELTVSTNVDISGPETRFEAIARTRVRVENDHPFVADEADEILIVCEDSCSICAYPREAHVIPHAPALNGRMRPGV